MAPARSVLGVSTDGSSRRRPRGRPTASSSTPGSASTRAADRRRLPRRARRQPPLLLALPAGRARQHPRLRRRRPHAGSTTSSAAPTAHARLCAALGDAGLGQVLDIVPNHMAIGAGQRAGGGTCSRTARPVATPRYFDVDWDPPEAKLRNTVLLPVLGDHYGRVLEAGELAPRARRRRLRRQLPRARLPVAPRSLDDVLAAPAAALPDPTELASSPTRFAACRRRPRPTGRACGAGTATRRCCARTLARLLEEEPEVAAAVDAEVAAHQRRLDRARRAARAPELPARLLADGRARARLPALLRRQHPGRRCGSRTSGLRRHPRARAAAGSPTGVIDGLRVDHPDGLRDPVGYLRRLREAAAATRGSWSRRSSSRASGCRDWPVAGTTGYDFVNLSAACSSTRRRGAADRALRRVHRRAEPTGDEVVDETKRAGAARGAGGRPQPPDQPGRRRVRAAPPLPRLHPRRARTRRCAR